MGAEDADEDFVDTTKLAVEVEDVVEFCGIEIFGDAGVRDHAIAEAGFGLPGGHGIFLDGLVGFIVGHSLFDQILKKLAGEDEALRGIEVAEHAFREDSHLTDDGGHLVEHVVDEDGGIRKDDTLDRGVGNVALVPKGNVFVGSHHVAADQAREAADLFAGDGIALVRHRGAAALLGAEGFLGFADFGALEMADFKSNFFERGGNEREAAEIVSMAVA